MDRARGQTADWRRRRESSCPAGATAAAERLFESVLEYASPLGLLAEEISAETGALLGNFPQAYSHIGPVNSALYLDRLHGRQAGPEPPGAEDEAGAAIGSE